MCLSCFCILMFKWYLLIKKKQYVIKPFIDNSNKVLIKNLKQNFHFNKFSSNSYIKFIYTFNKAQILLLNKAHLTFSTPHDL